eukprot:760109-Pyramimonas_sp.AAC.1
MAKRRARAQGAADGSDGEADVADDEFCEAFPTGDGDVVEFDMDSAPGVTGRCATYSSRLVLCPASNRIQAVRSILIVAEIFCPKTNWRFDGRWL